MDTENRHPRNGINFSTPIALVELDLSLVRSTYCRVMPRGKRMRREREREREMQVKKGGESKGASGNGRLEA